MLTFLLSAIPPLLKLIEQFVLWANEKKLVDQGRREAIAEAAQSLNVVLAKASAAAQEADERHEKDPSDKAFNPKYWRD
jgi:hypothetical protein